MGCAVLHYCCGSGVSGRLLKGSSVRKEHPLPLGITSSSSLTMETEILANKSHLSVSALEKQPPVPGLRGAVPEGGGSTEPQGLRDHGHL